jgi:GntR family transcriptional regulator
MVSREISPISWPSQRGIKAGLGSGPLHAQIATLIRDDIEGGFLAPGARLPAEHQLAEHFGISIAPVRQALLTLVGDGYLERRQGDGTFVRTKVVEWISMLSGFTEAHAAQLSNPELEVVSQGLEKARTPPGQLELSSSKVFVLRRLARSGGTPITLLTAYLDPFRFPGVEKIDFTGRSLYETLADNYCTKMARAVSTLDLIRADHDHALLKVPLGSFVLRVTSTTFAGEEPVEYAEILYRPDCFRFHFESVRAAPEVINVPRQADILIS